MKKILAFILCAFLSSAASAQILTQKDIERHAYLGDMSWSTKAQVLAKQNPLDESGNLHLSVITEFEGQSKDELYKKIEKWILSMSSNSTNALMVADKENGKIVTKCYLPNVAKRTMGDNSYRVSICPILTFDFKDSRVRFSFDLSSYEVLKKNDDSGYGVMMGSFVFTGRGVTNDNQQWLVQESFPFGSKHPKVTSSRAFVNSNACFGALTEKINDVLKAPLKVEEDNW